MCDNIIKGGEENNLRGLICLKFIFKKNIKNKNKKK